MKFSLKDKFFLSKDALITAAVILVLSVLCYLGGLSLIIPLLLFFLGVHLFYFKKATAKLFIQLGLLLTLIVFTTHFFMQYTTTSYFYIPVASVAMLTVLLYNDLQLGFMMAFISSVLAGLIVGYDFDLMLIFFVGSLVGMYTVFDARTRGRVILAGFFVGTLQVFCVILLNYGNKILLTQNFVLFFMIPLFFNGLICAFVVIATSKVFEMIFGVITNFSLLELADFNHPLLKRLTFEAPGTYHHSLVVSNVAETAAQTIGAHSLLTRVGAYYHDIGKLVKPEYFTENQLKEDNKHDNLEPSMSRLVILNHVKEGVELAKKYKLDQRIIDFIPEHHGTGIMHYFYQRALEGAPEGEVVNEVNFRYPGPKPQTKETAIVLLADSVEGAVRSLDDPTPTRIAETVRKIINNKFIDGQLDQCDITLRDLELIGNTFIRTLGAMYHARIKYPEKKNGRDSDKKSSENTGSKTTPNNPSRPKNTSS